MGTIPILRKVNMLVLTWSWSRGWEWLQNAKWQNLYQVIWVLMQEDPMNIYEHLQRSTDGDNL